MYSGLAYNHKNFYGGGIGRECEMFSSVEFGSEPYLIDIGDNVRLTYGVTFITHDGGLWKLRKIGIQEGI